MSISANLYLGDFYPTLLAHAVSRIKAIRSTSPLQSNTILLPSAVAIQVLHSRIGDTIGVGSCQFYRLARVILDQVAIPRSRPWKGWSG